MIKWIYEMGLSSLVYYVFHILGFVAVLLFNIWFCKKYEISKRKAVITTLIAYPIVYVLIYVLCWAESGFKNFGGNNIVRGFVYIPLVVYPVAKLLKIEWKRICDFVAPCVCVCQGVSHIGCIFTGCCEGYPSNWGIYHHRFNALLFPVQLFEAATALIIVGFLVFRANKLHYKTDGLSYPIMLILFGSTRFLWEFARNNEKIWLGCSALAFHALFMVIVGMDMFFTIREKAKKEERKLESYIHNPNKTRRRLK